MKRFTIAASAGLVAAAFAVAGCGGSAATKCPGCSDHERCLGGGFQRIRSRRRLARLEPVPSTPSGGAGAEINALLAASGSPGRPRLVAISTPRRPRRQSRTGQDQCDYANRGRLRSHGHRLPALERRDVRYAHVGPKGRWNRHERQRRR